MLAVLLQALAAPLLRLLGMLGLYTAGNVSGRRGAALDAAERKAKQEAKGRDAVAEEKRATVGADNRDLLDRLRGRDGDWGGV